MAKSYLALAPSEQAVTQAAAQIYAAYVIAGRVADGGEDQWLERSIQQAIRMAKTVDESVSADGEMD